MRVQITVDSATTSEIRGLMVALHHVGMTGSLATGVEGPECWSGTTPKLSEPEARRVLAELVEIVERSL